MFLSPGGADAMAIRARALTKARNNTDHAEGGLTGRGEEISCMDQREGRVIIEISSPCYYSHFMEPWM